MMNMKNFKLLKEDSSDYHIQHPSGHRLIVNKALMSDAAHGLIKKMDDGGTVDSGSILDPATKFLEKVSDTYNDREDNDKQKQQNQQNQQNKQNQQQQQQQQSNPAQPYSKVDVTYARGGRVRGYDEGGSVGKSWIDSAVDSAQQLGQKVNNAFGGNKVEQDYSGSQMSGNDYNLSDLSRQIKQPKTQASDSDNYARGGRVKGYATEGEVEPIGQNTVLAPEPQAPEPAVPVPQEPVNPMVQKGQSYEQLLNTQEQQAKELGAANVGAAQAGSSAYNQYAQDEAKLASPEALFQNYKAQDDQLAGEYMKGKIDPDRYWNNLSTPAKIGTGIGLALAGIGSSYLGQKNPVQEYLQNAIDHDIDSQKNDQSKKMNLWRMNKEAYGDETKANLATQNQLYTGLQAKIAQAAASAQAPQAKYNAEQTINDIEQKKIANRQRLALYGGGQQGSSGVNPLDMASDPNIVPEAARQKVIDELGKAQYIGQNEDKMMKLYDQAEKENTIRGRAGRLGFEPPSIKALRLMAMPLMHDEVGRVNPDAVKAFDEILPGPGERESTGVANRENFQNFINLHKQAPTARSFGIDPENFRSTTTNPVVKLDPKQRRYLDFAKAHPSNPLSQDFFAKHPELK